MDIRMGDKIKIKNQARIGAKDETRNKFAEYIIVISSLLYYIDIFIISSIAGSRTVRLQDLASLLAFTVIFYIIKTQGKDDQGYKNTVFLMAIFLLYVSVSNMFFYFKGDIDATTIFYIVKEVEFYTCFLMISYFFKNYLKGVYRITQLLMIFICIYGFYQVVTGHISYYGIGTIFERAPSISGSIYLVSSVLSFYLYRVFRDRNFKIYAFLTYLLTIFTISKTNIIGLTLFYMCFFALQLGHTFLATKRRGFTVNTRRILIVLAFVISLSLVFIIGFNNAKISSFISENNTFSRIIGRFGRLDSSYAFRSNKAHYYLEYFIGDSPMAVLFGRGKGITEYAFNVRTLAVDNQFTRAIIEVGLVGIIIWTSVIASMVLALARSENRFSYHLVISLFVGYLAMGVGYEVFVVTKTGIVFWFLLGVFSSNSKAKDYAVDGVENTESR